MEQVFLTTQVHFSASHRYHNPKFSDKLNKELFGQCNNPYGHGHNYLIEVTIRGKIDQQKGLVMNVFELKQILKDKVLDEVDHRYLNIEVPFFKEKIPSTENICIFVWKKIESEIKKRSNVKLFKVKVVETPTIWAEYFGK